MSKEAVQLSLPGFEQAHGRWRAEYERQIGTDRAIRNRSQHRDQAALHAARLERRALSRRPSAFPANAPSRAASIRPCIAAAPGRSAS